MNRVGLKMNVIISLFVWFLTLVFAYFYGRIHYSNELNRLKTDYADLINQNYLLSEEVDLAVKISKLMNERLVKKFSHEYDLEVKEEEEENDENVKEESEDKRTRFLKIHRNGITSILVEGEEIASFKRENEIIKDEDDEIYEDEEEEASMML